ncbi:MAG: hypothetical protein MI861_20165 [Pirellulales bacterium]|nr:hypothetical protein [Pirellulales bacterium]
MTLPSDASGDIGLSIEALLAAMPGRQKQVYVLTTEVWSQAVTIESRSLRRIDRSQIPQMMAFEAESLSGVPATQARTSLELLDAGALETTYWLSQIDSTRFAQAADAIAFNGGKLMGIAHPAGLPVSITGQRSDWTRVEQWDDITLAITRNGRQTSSIQFLEDSAAELRSAAAARAFLERLGLSPAPLVELLVGATPVDVDDIESKAANEDQATIQLSLEQHLLWFLQAWSSQLGKSKGIPLIRPIRQPASAQAKRTLAIAATAAAVIGVASHRYLTDASNDRRIVALEEEIAGLQEPIDQFESQQNRMAELEAEVNAREAAAANLERQLVRYRGQVGIHRSRIASLLKTLSETRPRDVMLHRITSDGDSIRVVGRSVHSESITSFAKTLAARLLPLNLSLEVPRREALLVTADGGPYEFEYVIRDGA